jgi:phosphonate transport system substrate-binding protein
MTIMRLLLAIALSCSTALCADPPLRLEFGVYPSDRASIMYRKFMPVLEALAEPLQQQLGRPVDIHLTIFKDYEDGIDALATGRVDFVRFGPASYILAHERNEDVALLAMELRKGRKRFNGLIVTRADSGIRRLSDLKGKRFAFGDAHSTIGRYLAQAELLDAGLVADDLASFEYLGRHDLVAKAVIDGTHDAGALKESTYRKLCLPDEVVVVKAYENVTKPWVARGDLDPRIRSAITAALLDVEEVAVLEELGCTGFTEADEQEYAVIDRRMKQARAFDPEPSTD